MVKRVLVRGLIGLVIASFIAAGIWQLGRWRERAALNADLLARAEQPTLVASDLVLDPPPDVVYRRARATGTYDTAREYVLLSRSFNGISGHHVVTPLRLADGRAILVDRGWVPLTMDEPPLAEAAPPTGTVTAEGVLVASQERGRFGPRDPEDERLTRAFRVDIEAARAHLPYPVVGVFLQLDAQQPPVEGLPRPAPFPPPDAGPHLSYAIQWFLFATAASVTTAAVVQRRRRALRGADEID